ncbi:hypothetical protein PYCC9005_003372 [Savitreella phatthalungensis]
MNEGQEAHSQESRFENLPAELLDAVLYRLPCPSDALALMQTSYFIRDRIMASDIWHHYLSSTWQVSNDLLTEIFTPPRQRSTRRPSQSGGSPTRPGHLPEESAYTRFMQRRADDRQLGAHIEAAVNERKGRLKVVETVSRGFLDNVDGLRAYRMAFGRRKGHYAVDYHCRQLEQHLCRQLGFTILRRISKHATTDPLPCSDAFKSLYGLAAVSLLRGQPSILNFIDLQAYIHGLIAEHLDAALEAVCDFHNLGQQRLHDLPPGLQIAAIGFIIGREGILPAQGVLQSELECAFLGPVIENHVPSIPINMVAIFCAVADALGFDAKPVSFPGKMLAVFTPKPAPASSNSIVEKLYVSPWDGHAIYTREDLLVTMRNSGLAIDHLDAELTGCSPVALVTRCARNIFDRIERGAVSSQGMPALYAALTALRMGGSRGPLAETQFSALVAIHFPYDIPLWEADLAESLPPAEADANTPLPDWQDTFLRTRLNDVAVRTPKRRHEQPREILHTVGTVFRHRLFGYYGVITGWDAFCDQTENWIVQMRVDSLPYGRYQPFYHVLVADESVRYVAQENVLPLAKPRVARTTNKNRRGETTGSGRSRKRRRRANILPDASSRSRENPRGGMHRNDVMDAATAAAAVEAIEDAEGTRRTGTFDDRLPWHRLAMASLLAAARRTAAAAVGLHDDDEEEDGEEEDDRHNDDHDNDDDDEDDYDDDNDDDDEPDYARGIMAAIGAHDGHGDGAPAGSESAGTTASEAARARMRAAYDRELEAGQESVKRLCAAEEIGKYFVRFDRRSNAFLPAADLREEYPDDCPSALRDAPTVEKAPYTPWPSPKDHYPDDRDDADDEQWSM